jgi:hypothetical protein
MGLVACKRCGEKVIGLLRGRHRKFCSDRCRLTWHRDAAKSGRRPVRLKPAGDAAVVALRCLSADDWERAVREQFDLSVTESQLVDLAALALGMSQDKLLKPETRLTAAARFQALVRQIDFPEVPENAEAENQTHTATREWPRGVR